MRTLLVLVCSLALTFAASGAQEKKKEEKPAPKKPAQTAQGVKPSGATPKAGGPHQQTNAAQRTPEARKGVEAGKERGKHANQTNAAGGQPVGGGQQKTKEKKGVQASPGAPGQAPGEAAAGKAPSFGQFYF